MPTPEEELDLQESYALMDAVAPEEGLADPEMDNYAVYSPSDAQPDGEP